MGRRRQAKQHAEERQAATQVLIGTITWRSGLPEQALQYLYHVGPDEVNGGEDVPGASWRRYLRGERTLPDDRMAAIAAAAVLNRHIAPVDVACLINWPGASRVLSVITPLLCDLELGRPVDQHTVDESLSCWHEERGRLSLLISTERASLEQAARKASDALIAASAALDVLLRAQSKAEMVGVWSVPTSTFMSLPLVFDGPLTQTRAHQHEIAAMQEWAAELAQSLSAARVDRFAFPALDLPWRDRLDPQQQSALDRLMSQWCPEFDPPSLCDECGWPELECCCDLELVDPKATFDLREPGDPPLILTERGWAARRPRALAPSWPGSRSLCFALYAALDAAAAKAAEIRRPARLSERFAAATELPQPSAHSSHFE